MRTNEIVVQLQKEVESLKRQLANHSEHERKFKKIARNEALFRNLMENSIDAVYLMDEKGKMIDVNSVACNMLNFSYEELLALTIDDIDPNYPSTEFYKFWENKPESVTLLFETKHRRKDGVCIPVELNGIAFRLDNQKYLYGVARNLTERKNVQQQILQLNETLEKRVEERTAELEAVNKELEAFAYTISHDLRAPLRAINGFTKILCEEYLSRLGPHGVKLCDIIRSNTVKMSKLIDDILAFSRLSRSEITLTMVDQNLMISQIIQEFNTISAGKKIHFSLENLPEVTCDYSMLKQVWTNLIDNAIKFTSKGSAPVIKIFCTCENKEVIFHIQDNGAGFDMKNYPRLFGVFHRFHNENEYPGIGVGLAIVQRIIQRMNGKIWAESVVDSGTTFHFALNK